MSITKHKWGDKNVSFSHELDEWVVLEVQVETSKRSGVYEGESLLINKEDSEVIAKHFNQDNESVLSKVGRIITGYKEYIGSGDASDGEVHALKCVIEDLERINTDT